jgi:hypothetical protein
MMLAVGRREVRGTIANLDADYDDVRLGKRCVFGTWNDVRMWHS